MKRLLRRALPAALALVALFASSAAATPNARSAASATTTVLKILVDKDGFYRVPQATLTAAGFTPSIPANVHLRTGGLDVPYKLPGGALEFYGQALDLPSTDTRTYWLSEEASPGVQMSVVAASGPTSPPTGTFQSTLNLRDRTSYFGSIVNGSGNNFFGSVAVTSSQPTVTKSFSLSHADVTQAATLRVDLQGYDPGSDAVNVSLNGTALGSISGVGYNPMNNTFSVPGGLLANGTNANTIPLNWSSGQALTDQYTLTYRHLFTADSDALDFTATPGQTLSVDGFSSNSVRLLDITNPMSPRELLPTVAGSAGNYTMGTTVPSGASRLYAFTDANVLAPKQVLQDSPSTLRSTSNQADLIVISNALFMSAVPPLVTQRTSEGLNVDLVDVQDVFDEFAPSLGAHDPAAIREFLRYAYSNWQNPKPKYVLFVGDASYDPRNYVGQGGQDFIPTEFVTAAFSPEPASDDALADLNGDGIPELAVGRLPVSTQAEASAMVTKIVDYSNSATRPKSALLAADNFDRGDYHFDSFSDDLAATSLTPNGVAVTKKYRGPGTSTDAATHAAIMTEASNGPILVNWFGHGAIQYWNGTPHLLQVSDANSITNAGKLSLYMMMTCQNAYFFFPGFSSLGETLLRAPNAAVAVWGSSGDTTPFDQVVAAKTATNALFSNPATRLGDAMLQAKAAISDIDVRHTWILLGDPTTRLRYSTPTAVRVATFAAKRTVAGAVRLTWRTANEADLAGFNVYRVSRGKSVKLNGALIRAKLTGSTRGASYSRIDTRARRTTSQLYRLQLVTLSGTRLWAAKTAVRIAAR